MTAEEQPIVDNISKDEELDVCVYSFGSTINRSPSCSSEIPFELLNNEKSIESGKDLVNGSIYLTNYRLFILTQQSSFCSFINCPLRLIESIESKENNCVLINCKELRSYRLTFLTMEKLTFWSRKLIESICPFNSANEIFALKTFQPQTDHFLSNINGDLLRSDFVRLQLHQAPWRISNINQDHKVCPTYPEFCVVPNEMSDEDLLAVAKFRYYRRFPSVVWRHKNGAVLVRASQPEVGWLFWRSKEDEKMIQEIINACKLGAPEGSKPSENQSNRLLIVDARSYAAALANRAKGGGFEYPPYYTNCDSEFMSLPNIHAVRRSSQMLRAAVSVTGQGETWLSQLEASGWLHNLSSLLQTAVLVVDQIDKHARPILVHCSDGWDRTPQIISLAEIMLDPYYRTIDGFKILIEREWIGHGHKFADRCGHGIGVTDVNDRCPVFLQWLDCVYQLYRQDEVAFQFNELLLLKLAQHTYTCLYGNFLCNNNLERKTLSIDTRTLNIWDFIETHRQSFLNYHYNDARNDVLRPTCGVRELVVWSNLYLYDMNQTPTSLPSESPSKNIPVHLKSFEDLCPSIGNGLHQTTSNPNISTTTDCDTHLLQNGRLTHLLSNNSPRSPSRLSRCLSSDSVFISHQLPNTRLNSQQNFFLDINNRTPTRNRTSLPMALGSDNQIKARNSLSDDISPLLLNMALAVRHSPMNPYGIDHNSRNLTTVKEDTNSISSTASSLSEAWSLTRINSSETNQSQKSVQTVNSNRIICSIRSKIDKDGLTKILDPTISRLVEKEMECLRTQENFQQQVRDIQTCVDLIPYVSYQSNLPPLGSLSQTCTVHRLDSSLSSSSWQKIDGKELTLTRWVPESSTSYCRLCNVKFNKWSTSRKYHCRECGETFCTSCSNFNKLVPSYSLQTPARINRNCFQRTNEEKSHSFANLMVETARPTSSCPIAIPTGCHQANNGQSTSFNTAGGQKVKG